MPYFLYHEQKIAYQTFGPKDAPIIIALHGWMDNSASFIPLAKHLTDFQIIALDLPGHGLSSHFPKYATFHFIDGVTLLIQLIEEYFTTPAILLGHSLGGCIASMASPFLQDKIEKAIFIDALGPLITEDEKSFNQYEKYLKKLKVFSNDGPNYPNKELAYAMRAKSGDLSLDSAKLLCDRVLVKNEKGYAFNHDRKLLLPSPSRMNNEMVLDFLKKSSIRSLYIEAMDGYPFNKNIIQSRINAMPNLSHQKLTGGHHLHMENPKAVAKAIKTFIKES